MSRGVKRAAAAALCLILLAAVPTALWKNLSGRFQDQYAAERWQGGSETEFVQISCMLDESAYFSYEEEFPRRQKLGESMAAETDEAFATAGSGITAVTVEGGGKSVNARAIGTFGSFSLFHPARMLSGSFYGENEANRDGVVLDMNLAWKLFGGYDLRGMSVSVNGVPVQVTGVTEAPEGIEAEAFGSEPTVWIPMELLEKTDSAPAVSCYELVLPNPVRGYGLEKTKALLSLSEESCDCLENTGRFSALNSLKNLVRTGSRMMRSSRIRYPFWENAARNAENRCAVYVGVAALLLLYPAGFVLVNAVLLLVRLRRTVRRRVEKKRKYWL